MNEQQPKNESGLGGLKKVIGIGAVAAGVLAGGQLLKDEYTDPTITKPTISSPSLTESTYTEPTSIWMSEENLNTVQTYLSTTLASQLQEKGYVSLTLSLPSIKLESQAQEYLVTLLNEKGEKKEIPVVIDKYVYSTKSGFENAVMTKVLQEIGS